MTKSKPAPDPGQPSSGVASPLPKPARRRASTKSKASRTPTKRKRRDTARPGAKNARDGSKKAEILALMGRGKGVTLAEIMHVTGWQPHTVRGFVSGTLTKKLALRVESFRNEANERAYRIAK